MPLFSGGVPSISKPGYLAGPEDGLTIATALLACYAAAAAAIYISGIRDKHRQHLGPNENRRATRLLHSALPGHPRQVAATYLSASSAAAAAFLPRDFLEGGGRPTSADEDSSNAASSSSLPLSTSPSGAPPPLLSSSSSPSLLSDAAM